MRRIKSPQATTESVFHQCSLELLYTVPYVKKHHGVLDILLWYLGKYGYHKGNQRRILGKCNLKCGVSFRSSTFFYVPASRSARLMKSPVKSSQYHLWRRQWKAMVCTASRELWGWYPAVGIMSIANQIVILPLPCINKNWIWVFSMTPEKAKASWDVGYI